MTDDIWSLHHADLDLEVFSAFEAVNAAARLDSLCREYKQDLILSASAYRQLGLDSQAWFQQLGEVLFRGKTQPVPVYGRK